MADTTFIDSALKGAQLWNMGFERQLQQQQFLSQEAQRRAQERRLSEQAAIEHDRLANDIQFRADMQKAAAKAAQESSPYFDVPDIDGGTIRLNRSPENVKSLEDAMMDNAGPVFMAHRPEALPQFLNAMAMSKFRNASVGQKERALDIQQQRADAYQQNVGTGMEPEAKTVIDPNTGNPITMIRKGRNAWGTVPRDVAADQERQVGNQGKKAITAKLIAERPDLVTIDDNGTPSVTPEAFARYQKEGGLTNANKTKAQETVSSALNSMQQIRQVMPMLNSATIGPRAAVEDIVVDRGLANIFPELMNKQRVSAAQLLSQVRSGVIRSLRTDSNIAEAERRSLESQVPGPAQFGTSPARALQQLQTIQEGVLQRAIRATANLKQPLSDELVQFVSPDDIQSFVQQKIMTPDQARAWYNARRQQP